MKHSFSPKEYFSIVFINEIPDLDIAIGDVGTVVDLLGDKVYVVEVGPWNECGVPRNVVTVDKNCIQPR